MLRVIETGRNPTMRHLHRTHRVSVSWLHERFTGNEDLDLIYETSETMCADIYTKAFSDRLKWQAVCSLINVVDPKSLSQLVKSKADLLRETGGEEQSSRLKQTTGGPRV